MFQSQPSVLTKLQPPRMAAFGSLRVLALAPLSAWAILWCFVHDSHQTDVVRSAALTAGASFWWSQGAGGTRAAAVLGLVGLHMIPLVCSRAMDNRPRLAWGLIWTLAALIVWAQWTERSAVIGGYADARGAAWIQRGVVVDRRPWILATGVWTACSNAKGRVDDEFYNRIGYVVAFDDREAVLAGRSAGKTRATPWLADLTTVDRALPARVAVSHGELDPRCLRYHARRFDMAQAKAFIRVLRPTALQAQRMAKADAPVAATVAEVAAEIAAGR